MPSTFFDRIDELKHAVGNGTLRGSVQVDQIYAHYQEVGEELHHPEGGKVYAMRDSLYEGNGKRMEEIAARTVLPEGSQVVAAMTDEMESLSHDYYDNAPHEFGDLRASGHPVVVDNGATVYDRAPYVHRLTEDELRAKDDVRRIFRFERS